MAHQSLKVDLSDWSELRSLPLTTPNSDRAHLSHPGKIRFRDDVLKSSF
ncbi:hypothetical protein [Funiculus sociatus]